MLELVNLLPKEAADILDKVEEIDHNSDRWKLTVDGLKKRLDMSHPHAADYNPDVIFRKLVDVKIADYCLQNGISFYVEKYSDLLEAQFIFQTFSEINNEISTEDIKQITAGKNKGIHNIWWESKNPSGWRIAAKGFIKPRQSSLHYLFEKENVPFFRIRECPICFRFYWAKQINSETCGENVCAYTHYNRKKAEKQKIKSQARKTFHEQDFSKTEGENNGTL